MCILFGMLVGMVLEHVYGRWHGDDEGDAKDVPKRLLRKDVCVQIQSIDSRQVHASKRHGNDDAHPILCKYITRYQRCDDELVSKCQFGHINIKFDCRIADQVRSKTAWFNLFFKFFNTTSFGVKRSCTKYAHLGINLSSESSTHYNLSAPT